MIANLTLNSPSGHGSGDSKRVAGGVDGKQDVPEPQTHREQNLAAGERGSAPEPEFLTKIETAKWLRCTTRTIDEKMRKGMIPFLKLGRQVLFPKRVVREHLEANYSVHARTTHGAGK
jgi:excisionase family DNA binding protein